jgi:hypothetical protein
MENPFPGMNPYLERHWRDVHHRVVTYACDQLAARLPNDLRARIDERVFVREEGELRYEVYPDVRVVERPFFEAGARPAGGLMAAEPLVVEIESEPVHQGFIEIVEAGSGDRIITVIEFLSLSNKLPGEGRDKYRRKQRDCRKARVNLVEIDLLRAGKRVLAIPEGQKPRQYRTPYRVCVTRGRRPGAHEIYRVSLRDRLPAIRIPLRKSDEDVQLELQPLIDQCYRNAAYDDIDYSRDPHPPLDSEDAAWAAGLLREKGLRK